jgi:hypothetical protein
MSIVGHNPESGFRIEIERAREQGPPWHYEGEAVTPQYRFPLIATVESDGSVSVDLPTSAPAGLGEKAKLIVRTAYRHARDEDPRGAPPRRIVRWRADR